MKKSLLVGFAALLLLLAFDAGMSLHTAARLRTSQSRIVEVAGIRIELRALLAAYVDAETGVRGYLLKDMEPEDVVDAVQRAVRGETVVAPAMTLKLVNLLQGGNAAATKADTLKLLTAREREILQQLSQGLSNKAIARVLDISHDTVKLHVKHILAKLNLSSRVEAAVFAVEQKAAGQARRS